MQWNILFLMLAVGVSCTTTNGIPDPKASPHHQQTPVVTKKQGAFYRQAFPLAQRFRVRTIPKNMLRSMDGDNTSYIEVDGPDGRLGYLRDFTGPVTTDASCPCSPLQVTLVFDAKMQLKDLLVPGTLEKSGHEPMTPRDLARLVAIAKAPNEQLLQLRRAGAAVDAVTGATKPAYKNHVVQTAALSTARIVGLVRDTKAILKGAPLQRDAQHLRTLVAIENPKERSQKLADFIGEAQSNDHAITAFRLMTQAYMDHLHSGGQPLPSVTQRILNPNIEQQIDAQEMAYACYGFAQKNMALQLATACSASLKQRGLRGPVLGSLDGTISYYQNDMHTAVRALALGAAYFSITQDPTLHLRLATAFAKTGNHLKACETAQELLKAHPLLHQAKEALTYCDGQNPETIVKKITGQQRKDFLKTRRPHGKRVPVLSVENAQHQEVNLELADAQKVTVALFFATWCPHCQIELPRVTAFVASLKNNKQLFDKVRVIGIRTAVEKETEPYEQFKQRFALNFPVWTDPVMALAFSTFAKSQGIGTGIPTLAVIDRLGTMRYLLGAGDYKDTVAELTWAVTDLLDTGD